MRGGGLIPILRSSHSGRPRRRNSIYDLTLSSLGRGDAHPQEGAVLAQVPPGAGAALALEREKPFEPLADLGARAVGRLDNSVTLRSIDQRGLERAPLVAPL